VPLLLPASVAGAGGVPCAPRDALRGHELAAWQMLCASMFAEQVGGGRTVLQYDPSIGSSGAFVIRELPDMPLPPAAQHNGGSASTAAVAAGAQGESDDSPTCQQLRHLADAFGSLAASAQHISASAPSNDRAAPPAAADAACTGQQQQQAQAPAGARAARSRHGRAAGVVCEEVPVLECDVSQLRVLVMNEKSGSSLHRGDGDAACASAGAPAAPHTDQAAAGGAWQQPQQQQQQQWQPQQQQQWQPQQQQQWQPQQQQAPGSSEASWVGRMSPASVAAVQQALQQQESAARGAGPDACLQQQAPACSLPPWFTAASLSGVLPPASASERAAPQQAWGRAHPAPSSVVTSAWGLGAPALDAPAAAAAGAAVSAECGARELMLRFDESLVDILGEVERLEQQQRSLVMHQQKRHAGHPQQQAAGQGQQQQQQGPMVLVQQQQQQQQSGLSRQPPIPWLQQQQQQQQQQGPTLSERHQQLQARMLQLQSEEEALQDSRRHVSMPAAAVAQRGTHLTGGAAWLQQQQQLQRVEAWCAGSGCYSRWEDDVDAVSDILNLD
jgi:hypothetical protein